MIIITENIEEKVYNHKPWYKEMDELIGEVFVSNANLENSLHLGQKIHIEIENPVLPTGMSIPPNSKINMELLAGKTFEVIDISQIGNSKTIKLGIRSTESSD